MSIIFSASHEFLGIVEAEPNFFPKTEAANKPLIVEDAAGRP
jgi:hypothetical protein